MKNNSNVIKKDNRWLHIGKTKMMHFKQMKKLIKRLPKPILLFRSSNFLYIYLVASSNFIEIFLQ